MNFERPKEILFQDILRENFGNQPKTLQTAEQVFNLVDGGFEAVDNARLNDEEKENIFQIIKDSVNTNGIDFESAQKTSVQEAARNINKIIDVALDRLS